MGAALDAARRATVPVAVHADHYGIKAEKDITPAQIEIPSLFDAGITSIAIDADGLLDQVDLVADIFPAPEIA